MTIDDLLAENKQLRAENAELKQRLADLEAVVQNLKEQLEAAQRTGKRQAAPFSKGAPKAKPKKPGQKTGHPAAHRAVPAQVNRVVEASLPATLSRLCGAGAGRAVQVQYQEDIPRPVPTIVTAVTASGAPYRNRYSMLWRVAGGKVAEFKEYNDSALVSASFPAT